MSKTLNLKIVGEHTMHCAGCECFVTFALSQLPGVEEVKAELDWIGYEVEAA